MPRPTEDLIVQLPADNDYDVRLDLPNGQQVALQWRIEHVTMDVCLPEPDHIVTCWKGFDLEDAPAYHPQRPSERVCGQLCIGFDPKVLTKPTD